jgi:acetyl-CoA carboxylase carboxyltransferase component
MKERSCCSVNTRLALCFAGTLLAFLVVGWMVRSQIQAVAPAPVGQNRADLRREARLELRKQEQEELTSYSWMNQDKGIVRIPMERAMELTVEEYQEPEAARSKLIERVETATAQPDQEDQPQQEPEPSPFE